MNHDLQSSTIAEKWSNFPTETVKEVMFTTKFLT
jgi:hypothetical protein